jgi:hypothetical protein
MLTLLALFLLSWQIVAILFIRAMIENVSMPYADMTSD